MKTDHLYITRNTAYIADDLFYPELIDELAGSGIVRIGVYPAHNEDAQYAALWALGKTRYYDVPATKEEK